MSAYEWIRARTAVAIALVMAVLGFVLGARRERQKWTGRF